MHRENQEGSLSQVFVFCLEGRGRASKNATVTPRTARRTCAPSYFFSCLCRFVLCMEREYSVCSLLQSVQFVALHHCKIRHDYVLQLTRVATRIGLQVLFAQVQSYIAQLLTTPMYPCKMKEECESVCTWYDQSKIMDQQQASHNGTLAEILAGHARERLGHPTWHCCTVTSGGWCLLFVTAQLR
jgi:hypothetical protein